MPATIISLVFGIVVSLMFPADTTPDDVRLKHVMDDRRGTVVERSLLLRLQLRKKKICKICLAGKL